MTEKQFEVIVSDRARKMLRQHVRFLVEISPDAAQNIKDSLLKAFRSLQTMPERFPFFEAEFIPPDKYRKLFVPKWYLVLYQIQEDTVYIDYVLDCRRRYRWLK